MTILELKMLHMLLNKMYEVIRNTNCNFNEYGESTCERCDIRYQCDAILEADKVVYTTLNSRSYFDEGEVF